MLATSLSPDVYLRIELVIADFPHQHQISVGLIQLLVEYYINNTALRRQSKFSDILWLKKATPIMRREAESMAEDTGDTVLSIIY